MNTISADPFIQDHATPSRPGAPRVVFADDDPVTLNLVTHRLEREGYHVEACEDGAAALKALLREPPELCVLDVQMPYVNGLDVLTRMRKEPRLAQVPVVILTAIRTQEQMVRAFELGASDYLCKPFSPVELLTRVRRLLR